MLKRIRIKNNDIDKRWKFLPKLCLMSKYIKQIDNVYCGTFHNKIFVKNKTFNTCKYLLLKEIYKTRSNIQLLKNDWILSELNLNLYSYIQNI